MDEQPAAGEATCQRQPSEAVVTFPPHVPAPLNDAELVGELERLHQSRVDTLRHGASHALAQSTARIEALEAEYLRRHPARELLASRLRHPLHGGERERVSGR
jgi:hypothetical protein